MIDNRVQEKKRKYSEIQSCSSICISLFVFVISISSILIVIWIWFILCFSWLHFFPRTKHTVLSKRKSEDLNLKRKDAASRAGAIFCSSSSQNIFLHHHFRWSCELEWKSKRGLDFILAFPQEDERTVEVVDLGPNCHHRRCWTESRRHRPSRRRTPSCGWSCCSSEKRKNPSQLRAIHHHLISMDIKKLEWIKRKNVIGEFS